VRARTGERDLNRAPGMVEFAFNRQELPRLGVAERRAVTIET